MLAMERWEKSQINGLAAGWHTLRSGSFSSDEMTLLFNLIKFNRNILPLFGSSGAVALFYLKKDVDDHPFI
jgi:hypothetical protein